MEESRNLLSRLLLALFVTLTSMTVFTGPGEVDTTFSLTNAGACFVVVSNQFNSMTSAVANLAVGLPPQNAQFRFNPGHFPQLQISGSPGYDYVPQFTANLLPPVTWQSLGSVQTDTNGIGAFVDTNVVSAGPVFYRVSGQQAAWERGRPCPRESGMLQQRADRKSAPR